MYNRQIQTFLYVADSGSFSKAAEQLFITPASVMHQMNALENRLDIKLLERTNHGITLTPAGHSIYKDARRIIELSKEAVNQARTIANQQHYLIRVGTSLLNPCTTLIDLWSKISKFHTNFQIKIVPFEDNHLSILSTITSLGKYFDILVGACGSNEWRSRCNTFLLGNYKVCCAVPRKHKLSKKKQLQISDLYGENLMMVRRGDSESIDILRTMLEKNHPQVHIINTPFFYDIDVFNTCEQTGNLLLTLDAWTKIHPSLITIPVKWHYTVPYGLLYAKKPSQDVLAFLEVIKQFTE